jgi:hypothetical protein
MVTNKKAASEIPPTMKAGVNVPHVFQETTAVRNVTAGYRRN